MQVVWAQPSLESADLPSSRGHWAHTTVSQTEVIMTSRDEIPLDDVAILQLFKDNLLNHTLNGNSDRVSSDDSELSDLESVISQDARDMQGARGQESQDAWPSSSSFRPSVDPSVSSRPGYLAEREDLRSPRRCPGLTSSRSRHRRLGKDEKLAQEANLPFTVRTLVALPMDEFNDLLSKNELSEEQLNVCRDIRRRGKNKVAAQNCRQRKIEQIDELQLKLKKAVDRRDKVKQEHERLYSVYSMEAERLKKLSETVLNYFNKDNLNFTLQVVGDEVNILPKKEVKEELSPSAMENFDQFLPFNPFYNINLNNNNSYNSHVTQGGCPQNNPIYELKHFNNFY